MLAVAAVLVLAAITAVLAQGLGAEPSAERGAAGTADPASVDPASVERPLLLTGSAGVRQVDGDRERVLVSEPVVTAVPDLQGGVVFQPAGAGGLRWLRHGEDEAVELPVGSDPAAPELQAVAALDGEATVLFTRRAGRGENEVETLHAYGLASGVERELGVTGRHDSGLGGVAVAADQLLYASCHQQCALYLVPQGVPTHDTERLVQLVPPGNIQGLSSTDALLAYVQLPPPIEAADSEAVLVLLLREIASGERRRVLVPWPTEPVGHDTIDVELGPGGDSALLSFAAPHGATTWQTLLVDRLDTDAPRQRWIESDERVRFAQGVA